MFLKLTKSGGRQYAQLVESFRNEAGQPRQRTICTLGRLEPGGDVDKLIAALPRARGLEATNAVNPLDGLRFEGSRCAGDVWVRIPLIADTHSRLIADSVPGDRGHPGWGA